MTTVITGATGHIGVNLIPALLEQGRMVRAVIHRTKPAIADPNLDVVKGDIGDVDSLCRAFEGADVVYHLAAAISLSKKDWPLVEKTNVVGTRNVVEACLRLGVRRLVSFSSIHAIADNDDCIDESCTLNDLSCRHPYDRSKAAAERALRDGIERGLDTVIVSPTGVIGPYDWAPSFMGQALLMMVSGKLPARITGGFNWVDVRDVVAGAMAAEQKAVNGAKYILSGHWVSIAGITLAVHQIAGSKVPSFIIPTRFVSFIAPLVELLYKVRKQPVLFTRMAMDSICGYGQISHDRATRELGYKPRRFEQTISDTLAWFGQNGYI
ncbi:MAG: NAD-dependent epimerase/dehydratase family protein [Chloroflexi bacterium]|mgnify:CR=1 FL=1|jgi:dihydroflavonol-4-reductase|nr:NAD-dependent epimerase/dehydratase family protein [Chloroflexota bacterium]MBT7081124.1 NAD-dependent epimerase/dehydratase family protein [Chloroflexota bacterium]MBT7289265.1 NAD-dependent epimerase/dehydratase family protein [Chloroflexota bacterium]